MISFAFFFFFYLRVKTIERSALQILQEKIFAHRSTLTEAFEKHDCDNTGNATSYVCMGACWPEAGW